MNKNDVIELGKFIVAGVVVGAVVKTIACVAVEVAKAKAATASEPSETTTVREINYDEIPAEIRAKLESSK